MKKLMLSLVAVLALSTTFYLASCEVDPCEGKDCGPHGTCNTAGSCDCEAGYEIDPVNGRCDIITSTLWLGDFNAEDFDTKGVSATGKYTSKIAAVTGNSQKVTIENLGFYECKNTTSGALIPYFVEGDIKGDSIKINFKTCNNQFKGAGFYDRTKKTITINYTATYGSAPNVKTDINKAVLVKK